MYPDRITHEGIFEVISCGTKLSESVRNICTQAHHIFGSRMLLAYFEGEQYRARLHPLVASQLEENLKAAISLASSGCKVALLASGDALYHGIGCLAARIASKGDYRCRLRFHPGPTAFQSLCHKLGLSWSDARLFSAHTDEPPLRQLLEIPFSITYGGIPHTATSIARALVGIHPASKNRRCVLAEYLDTPRERIVHCTLGESVDVPEMSPTSILVLLAEGASYMPFPLGLPDSCYKTKGGCITSPEVRAVALSKLRLPPYGILWDLGAGSGSVGLEAAALRPGIEVFGVEKEHTRCQNILENRQAMGLANYRLVEGEIMDCLGSLPLPDRVFIGGGGRELPTILGRCIDLTRKDGLVIASTITTESVSALSTMFPEQRLSILSLDIAEEGPLGPNSHQLVPKRRIHLFTFKGTGKSRLVKNDVPKPPQPMVKIIKPAPKK